MPVPLLVRQGRTKTVFENFWQVAKGMGREQELLRTFFSVSLSAQCTLAPISVGSGDYKMVMSMRVTASQVDRLLNQFAREFVESPGVPGSFDTRLERDGATGLHMLVCNQTGSKRCISRLTQRRG